jgi:hypothetical protein
MCAPFWFAVHPWRLPVKHFFQLLAVVAQAIQTGREAVHDCQQILNRFLFRRELFAVEPKKIGAVLGAETLEPRESKSGQSILVGYHKVGRHLPHLYAVHNRREFRSLEIEPTTNSLDKIDVATPRAPVLGSILAFGRHVGRWRRRAPLPVVRRNWGWNFSEPKPSLTEFSARGGEEIASMRFPCVCGGNGTCGGPREAGHHRQEAFIDGIVECGWCAVQQGRGGRSSIAKPEIPQQSAYSGCRPPRAKEGLRARPQRLPLCDESPSVSFPALEGRQS